MHKKKLQAAFCFNTGVMINIIPYVSTIFSMSASRNISIYNHGVTKKTPKCSERVWEVMPQTCMGNLERVGPYLYSCYGLWDFVSWRLVEENIYRKQDVFGLLKPWLHHPCLENVSSVISNMRLVSRFQDAGMFEASQKMWRSKLPIPISSGSCWSPFCQPAPGSFELHIYCVMQLLLLMVSPWRNQHLGFFSYGVVPHGFITLDFWCVCHTFCIYGIYA